MALRRSRELIGSAAVAAAAIALTACGSTTQGFNGDPTQGSNSGISSSALTGKQIPIRLADGGQDPIVEVSVADGDPVPVLLDTGSSGLRIAASAVGKTGLTVTDIPTEETFADGTKVSGHRATAPVRVGELPTGQPINVQLIESVTCQPSGDCPGGVSGLPQLMGGYGIMGVSLIPEDNYSPLLQLVGGVPAAYSIAFDGNGGAIRFEEMPQNPAASFQMPRGARPLQANGAPGWDDQAVPVCWSLNNAGMTCGPTVFDSGSTATTFPAGFPGLPPNYRPHFSFDSGMPVSVATSESATSFWTFQSTSNAGGYPVTAAGSGEGSGVNSGKVFFAKYLVTYELQTGKILLSSR